MTYKDFRLRMLLLDWQETKVGIARHYTKGNRTANPHLPGGFDPTIITEDSEGQTSMMILKSTQELYDLIMDIEEREDFGSYDDVS